MSVQSLPRSALALACFLAFSTVSAGFDDMLKSAGDMLEGSAGTLNTDAVAGGALNNKQIGRGLKQALSVGAERAVDLLGKSGGFLDDASVRIPLPDKLESVGKALRAAGQGKYVDDFETTVNRAAEQAVPETLGIVKKTVRGMTLEDVRGILNGGDSAATDFLREKAGDDLRTAVKPIVASATDQAGATSAYKKMVEQGSGYASGLMGNLGGLLGGGQQPSSWDLDEYVTDKALDGLFLKLAAEEKAIRENPMARTTDLLKKVFAK